MLTLAKFALVRVLDAREDGFSVVGTVLALAAIVIIIVAAVVAFVIPDDN